AFSNEGFEQGRYQTGLQNFLTIALKGARLRAAFISFIIFCLFGGIVLVMWYGATLVQSEVLSPGELARFMLYTMFVAGAMGSFAELWTQVQRTLGASHRVRELLREEPEPLPLPVPQVSTNGPVSGHRLRGDVAFDNVEFSYPSRKDIK